MYSGSTIDDFKFQAYISLNLEIGGRALIGAWVLKGTNTVLQQHCHPLAFPTFKDKDLQSLNFPPYNLPYTCIFKLRVFKINRIKICTFQTAVARFERVHFLHTRLTLFPSIYT